MIFANSNQHSKPEIVVDIERTAHRILGALRGHLKLKGHRLRNLAIKVIDTGLDETMQAKFRFLEIGISSEILEVNT